jgi:hypothetical protein
LAAQDWEPAPSTGNLAAGDAWRPLSAQPLVFWAIAALAGRKCHGRQLSALRDFGERNGHVVRYAMAPPDFTPAPTPCGGRGDAHPRRWRRDRVAALSWYVGPWAGVVGDLHHVGGP